MSSKSFFLGISNFGLTIFIFGAYPQYFWIFYCLKVIFLYYLRYKEGRSRGINYYLLDFCWIFNYINLFFCLFIYFTNDQEYQSLAIRFIFIFANIIGWFVIYENKLIFHSILHIATLFIHLEPVLLSYTYRWKYDFFDKSKDTNKSTIFKYFIYKLNKID